VGLSAQEPVFVSAEVRWFWQGAMPDPIDAWFRRGAYPPGGGRPRTDEYLRTPGQHDLGVKRRGGAAGVEVKGLVERRGSSTSPFAGRIQIWCKWTSDVLTIDGQPRIAVHKTRWVRKYDTAGSVVTEVELDATERPRHAAGRLLERGCQLELVTLRVDDMKEPWSSLGFEAFGALDTLEDSLRRTMAHLSDAPSVTLGAELSYPEWLDTLRA
jgi:hypothetical protein